MDDKPPSDLFAQVYGDLKKLARWFMKNERDGHTLDSIGLVSEVWLKLFHEKATLFDADRVKIIKVATREMRHVLVDHARRRNAEKRWGKMRRVPLDDVLDAFASNGLQALEIQESLDALESTQELAATAFTMRHLAGFSVAEIAETLNVRQDVIYNELRLARSLLQDQLAGGR